MFNKKNPKRRIATKSAPTKSFKKDSSWLDNLKTKFKRIIIKRSRNKPSGKVSGPKASGIKLGVNMDRKYISYVVIIVLLLLIVVPAIFLGRALFKGFYGIDFEKELGDSRVHEQEWKGEKRLNVLLVGMDTKSADIAFVDYLAIIVFDPEKKDVGVFNIDTNITVYVPSKKASLTLKKLYNLGNDKQEPESMDLIIEGVEELTAVNVDRYLTVDESGLSKIFLELPDIVVNSDKKLEDPDIATEDGFFEIKKGGNELDEKNIIEFLSVDEGGEDLRLKRQNEVLREMVLSLDKLDLMLNLSYLSAEIKNNIKSDFSKTEFRRFIWSLRSVSFDDIKTGYTKQNSLYPQSKGIVLPIIERIDIDLSEVFFNLEVQKEQARIEVFNGTSTGGIAARKARNISNTGAKVISVGNSRDLYEKTTIYTSNPEKYKQTVREINNIFTTKPILKEEEFPYRHTGDIVLVIGDDAVND